MCWQYEILCNSTVVLKTRLCCISMATASVFLKLIPGCEGVNNRDIREWNIEGEEQLMFDSPVVDTASHYW